MGSSKIHIIIKSPSGGVWNTARETAIVWANDGYDVHLVSALTHEVPVIKNVKNLVIFIDFAQILLSLVYYLNWRVTII